MGEIEWLQSQKGRWTMRDKNKRLLMGGARQAALVLVVSMVVSMVVGWSSAASAEPVSFQYRTTVDATDVGGEPLTPVRLIYTFDSNLAPGSGFTGSGPIFSGYGPLSGVVLEVGNRCVRVSGPGTAISVFNDAGFDPVTDSYDVRADTSAGAVVSGPLFNLTLTFFRFLLVDNDSTMFTSTALPLTPDFAALAELQHVELRLMDPVTLAVFSLVADSGFQLSFHRPVESLQALLATTEALNIQAGLKKELTKRLQAALNDLNDGSPSKIHHASSQLSEYIHLVEAQRGKKIPAATADQLTADARSVIDQLPPEGC
jgi:hypothetical protein